jgi:prepilin-type N-terminal cleavage/methylation domain-containing protein
MVYRMYKVNGMTLVEVIITVAIFSIISIAIADSISSFYRYNSYTIAQANQVAHARRGVEYIVRDIREMTYADDGSFPLVDKTDHSISFYSDIDRDDSVELVVYELASTTLRKYIYDASGFPPSYSTSTPDQTYTISEYVQNGLQGQRTFTYYDVNGAEATSTTSVADIRYINVTVIVNIDPLRDPGEFTLRSSAALRNLKEGI